MNVLPLCAQFHFISLKLVLLTLFSSLKVFKTLTLIQRQFIFSHRTQRDIQLLFVIIFSTQLSDCLAFRVCFVIPLPFVTSRRFQGMELQTGMRHIYNPRSILAS